MTTLFPFSPFSLSPRFARCLQKTNIPSTHHLQHCCSLVRGWLGLVTLQLLSYLSLSHPLIEPWTVRSLALFTHLLPRLKSLPKSKENRNNDPLPSFISFHPSATPKHHLPFVHPLPFVTRNQLDEHRQPLFAHLILFRQLFLDHSFGYSRYHWLHFFSLSRRTGY